jgi:hypothetical protein
MRRLAHGKIDLQKAMVIEMAQRAVHFYQNISLRASL